MEQSTQVRKYFVMCSVDKDSDAKKLAIEVDYTGFTLEMAMSSYMGSTSPRVHAQSKARAFANKNGGKFPDVVKINAAEYARGQGGSMIESKMSPDEMLEFAKSNPEYMAKLKASLGL